MKTASILIAAAGALLIALPAAAQPKAENTCFWTRELRNHTVGGDHVLYLDDGGRADYKVETSDNCLAGASSSDPIVMVNRGGSGQICNKMDLDISVRGARCIVSNMTKLSPAEAAALPKKIKP